MSCEPNDPITILDDMKKGDWKKLPEVLDYFAENADSSCLSPGGTEYMKHILGIAKDYLDANKDTDIKDLTKLDEVDGIIKTFAYYTDMITFAKGLPANSFPTTISYLMDVAKCKKGSVGKLSNEMLHTLIHGIAQEDITLVNRSLNGDIVMKLIEENIFTRQQILAAMTEAKTITEAHRGLSVYVVNLRSTPLSYYSVVDLINILNKCRPT